uniref:Uncharacterized protein n=1 Tax=Nelumbo nucifera TaxID=4432 RepID=A0A822YWU3_NELNU|nr:TPA_asm: hypothetical protein HUJ06_007284 [Nelumbo nucifera]
MGRRCYKSNLVDGPYSVIVWADNFNLNPPFLKPTHYSGSHYKGKGKVGSKGLDGSYEGRGLRGSYEGSRSVTFGSKVLEKQTILSYGHRDRFMGDLFFLPDPWFAGRFPPLLWEMETATA